MLSSHADTFTLLQQLRDKESEEITEAQKVLDMAALFVSETCARESECRDMASRQQHLMAGAEQQRQTLQGVRDLAAALAADTCQAVEECSAALLDFKKYKTSAKKKARGLERANFFLREAVHDTKTRVEPLVVATTENARALAKIVSDLQADSVCREQLLEESALSRRRLSKVHELGVVLVRELAVAREEMEHYKIQAALGVVALEGWGREEQVLREALSERLGAVADEARSLEKQLEDSCRRQMAAEASEGELNVSYQRLLSTHGELQGALECKIKEIAAADKTVDGLRWKLAQGEEALAKLQHMYADLQLQFSTTTNQLCDRVSVLECDLQETDGRRLALCDKIEVLELEKRECDLRCQTLVQRGKDMEQLMAAEKHRLLADARLQAEEHLSREQAKRDVQQWRERERAESDRVETRVGLYGLLEEILAVCHMAADCYDCSKNSHDQRLNSASRQQQQILDECSRIALALNHELALTLPLFAMTVQQAHTDTEKWKEETRALEARCCATSNQRTLIMEALTREQSKQRARDDLSEEIQAVNERLHVSQTQLQTALSRIFELESEASSHELQSARTPPTPASSLSSPSALPPLPPQAQTHARLAASGPQVCW